MATVSVVTQDSTTKLVKTLGALELGSSGYNAGIDMFTATGGVSLVQSRNVTTTSNYERMYTTALYHDFACRSSSVSGYTGTVTMSHNTGNNIALGIGWDHSNLSANTYALMVAGTTFCTNGNWAASDIRYKENIIPLNNTLNCLDLVKQLNPVTYTWKTGNIYTDTGDSLGFIAQEVQDVLNAYTFKEKIVNEDGPEGSMAINELKLIPILTAAIKELCGKVETLTSKVAELETKLIS